MRLRKLFAITVLAMVGLTVRALDLDGNRRSDVWEALHSVNGEADPSSDWDGDGQTLAEEAAFGTDPHDPRSATRATIMKGPAPGTLALGIGTQVGKRYRFESSGDLATWLPLGGEFTGDGTAMEVLDFTLDSLSRDRHFFRSRFVDDIDADGDGMTAWEEHLLGLDDANPDFDGDRMPDGLEWAGGFDPALRDGDGNGTDDGLDDADGDGMPNGYEVANGLDPRADDALEDLDGDRWPNVFEWAHGVRVDVAGQDPDPANPVADPPPVLLSDAAEPAPDGIRRFRTIYEALDVANSEIRGANYSVIEVKAGTYREFPSFGWDSDIAGYRDISVLVLAETGSSAGPVVLDGDYYGNESGGWTVVFAGGGTTVLDGFMIERGADGALYAFGGARVKLLNTTMRDNIASWGAGIFVRDAAVECVHCTFQRNSASEGGNAINAYTNGEVTLVDSVVWDEGGLAPEELLVDNSGSIAVGNSIVSGGEFGGLDIDPLLREEDARLTAQSPARNAASGAVRVAYDRDGESRVGPADFGADEFVDVDGDSFPDHLGAAGEGGTDGDRDGLSAAEEYNLHGTKWSDPDTDGDGMSDGWEASNGLDPLLNDGFYDGDGDGLSNLEESELGTNPFHGDTDADGMPDPWEVEHGLDPLLATDSLSDPDQDGLESLFEYEYGSDPNDLDTDDDNVSDLVDGWPRNPVVSPPRLPSVRYAIVDVSDTRIANVNDSADGIGEYFEDPVAGNSASYAPSFEESVAIGDRLVAVANIADDDTLVGSYVQGAPDAEGQTVFGGTGGTHWPKHACAWPDTPLLPAGEVVSFSGGGTDSIAVGRNLSGEYLVRDYDREGNDPENEWRLLRGMPGALSEVPATRHTPGFGLEDAAATFRALNNQGSVVFGGNLIPADGGSVQPLPGTATGLTDRDAEGKETVIGNDYIWRDGQSANLPFLAHATVSTRWINNCHEIVAETGEYPPFSNTIRRSPVLIRNGEEIPLEDLADLTGWTNVRMDRINDLGMISGTGHHNGIAGSRFLLLPVEVVDINDHADSGDDESIQAWDTSKPIIDANVAWIDAHRSEQNPEPRMPQLEFRIPGLRQGVTLEAKLEVTYDRPYVSDQEEDTVRLPASGDFKSIQDGVWKIWEDYDDLPFFGGDATLTFKIAGGAETTFTFAIGGKSPEDDKCKAYTQSRPGAPWYAYAIEKHESQAYNPGHYNQFWERNGNSSPINSGVNYEFTKGDPLKVRSPGETGVGGTGLAQVTGDGGNKTVPVPREVLWNWQANVDAFLAILAEKQQIAQTWMNDPDPRNPPNPRPNGQRPQAVFDTGSNVPVPDRSEAGVTFTDAPGGPPIEDAVAIKAYNGAAVHYCFWKGPSIHQWGFDVGQNDYVRKVCEQVDQQGQ